MYMTIIMSSLATSGSKLTMMKKIQGMRLSCAVDKETLSVGGVQSFKLTASGLCPKHSSGNMIHQVIIPLQVKIRR